MTTYPEHEKLQAVKKESQAIGEFLEWYGSNEEGGVRAVWRRKEPCPECDGEGGWKGRNGWIACHKCAGSGQIPRGAARLIPDGRTIEQVLAAYFEIDLDKIHAEKEAMYRELRRQAQGASP